MGTELTKRKRASKSEPGAARGSQPQARPAPARPSVPNIPRIPWLDRATAAGVVDIVRSLAAGHPAAYAVILFGSVARREERPLDDPEPSDVDLLLLFDPAVLDPAARELTREQELALIHTIGEADYRQQSPREIKFIFAPRTLEGCDELFIEHVAHDGILLWARGLLPKPLAPIAARGPSALMATRAG
jgi:predicted nucleotidyltransferase